MNLQTHKTFEIGDEVSWTSQSSGFKKTKNGTIVSVIQPNSIPHSLIPKLASCSKGRKEISYVVKIQKEKTKPKYYWPLVKYLNLSKDLPEKEISKIEINTINPEKWVVIDSETLSIWLPNNGLPWRNPNQEEKGTLEELFYKTLKKISNNKSEVIKPDPIHKRDITYKDFSHTSTQ